MSEKFNVGVVGATTAIGKALVELLEQREFPLDTFRAIEQEADEDVSVLFKGKNVAINAAKDFDWSTLHIVFFCSTDEVSLKYAPLAADAGVAVIDNSSAFNARPEIPMVIPHINQSAIGDFRNANIIISPAASVVQLWTVLKPIYDQVGISRINVTCHHSVSSAGDLGINELARQCGKLLNGLTVEDNPFSAQLAFNVLPQVGTLQDNGLTDIEQQVIDQSVKLLADSSVMINSTSVMTPVFFGLAQSVNIETCNPVDPEQLTQWFDEVEVIELDSTYQPTQVEDANGSEFIHVGRLRVDPSHPLGVNLWSVADNIRTTSALNSLKIAETLIRDFY
ncbi:aspartate-semialdehyde dehydrogenase [Psychrobium sp. 1_MG-2023]|uniref:aspartate-semialdehyde dehydrogenase n=1 Tax=Psychrobium sp. 1_MG-2023 TaxID=3062624 RepID=UPI000C332F05|nr:aspartate-semialdehyde dehydrogenase [Psychrobium sp. 1_MG-2023]MDP2561753.1 aspartate-semialdehyde dehydrogenase [Psychrobium sp. 1_MG-2023]PKF59760.1 aspartate-semialdehyde dehydrogenase [Alteromonadales bacterium alter-6D02]